MRLFLCTLALASLPIVAGMALVPLAHADVVPAGSTVLVDRPSGFGALPFDGANDSQSGGHSVSADGRYAVFTSRADSLFDGDDDRGFNVFRLDRAGGKIEQVNTSSTGAQPEPNITGGESISADGRYVAFSSSSDGLVAGAPGIDLYVKDMNTGKIELASRATGPDGQAATGAPIGVISGDGRHVAFTVDGPLDADNADGVADQTDAYVRGLDTGKTRMVSVTSADAAGGGVQSGALDIDWNGDAVAFVSEAPLDSDDKGADDPDAYLRTAIGSDDEETCFVSLTTGQLPGADAATEVALSGDGLGVAWGAEDAIYFGNVINSAMNRAHRVDVPQLGGASGRFAGAPAFEPVAAAGQPSKRLYFVTDGALSPVDTNQNDDAYDAEVAFIGDPDHVHLATSGKANGEINAVGGAGEAATVVFSSSAPDLPGSVRGSQVYLRADDKDRNISQPLGRAPRSVDAGDAFIDARHAVSDDGRVVAFQTRAPALGADDPDRPAGQVVVRDVASGRTSLVSARPDGTPGDDESLVASIDATGDHVAFLSDSVKLLATGNPTGNRHVYVRDLRSGAMVLVDRNDAGDPLDRGVSDARISPDGLHLVYVSRSEDAPEAPPGTNSHAYLVDLITGKTVLVDRAADGTPANASAGDGVDLSGDGSRVAFTTAATNLGVATDPDRPQLYVRDVLAKTTEWASPPEDGNPLHSEANDPSLSRSGTRVAFEQFDPGFGNGMHDHSQLFVRDLEAKTTTLASQVPGAEGTIASDPSLSADGRRVAFVAEPATAATFAPGASSDPASASGAYLRDLSAGTTTLVSVRLDGHGAPPGDFEDTASVDGTGSCVVFSSTSASAFTDPAYGPDFTHVYLRAVDDDCPGTTPRSEPPPGNGDTPPADGPGETPASDTTAPTISAAKVTHRRFAVGKASTARSAAARGTTFVFSLSEPAATTIAISRRAPGRRSGKRCVAPRKGLTRHCTRTIPAVTLKRAGTVAGVNRIAFSGRVARKALKPGSYLAVLVARDKAGNASKAKVLKFSVTRGGGAARAASSRAGSRRAGRSGRS